jgi:methyl-accepting chemotaxis protein
MQAIATSAERHAHGSRGVGVAIQKSADSTRRISVASQAQASGSERVLRGADAMRALTVEAERATEDQIEGTRKIAQTIQGVSRMASRLSESQRVQTDRAARVLGAMETIRAVAERQAMRVDQLRRSLETLQGQSRRLQGEIQRFRL